MVNPSTSDRFVSVIRGLFKGGLLVRPKVRETMYHNRQMIIIRVAAPVCSIKGREVTAKDLILILVRQLLFEK